MTTFSDIRALAVAIALTTTLAFASDRSSDIQRYYALRDHADVLRPKPPHSPLRAINISDIEVREIQAAAVNVLPKAIVNIAGVSVGCPCEDGPKCTDQVWVDGWTPAQTRGLLFSRIDDKWILDPVQKWWLAYENFLAHPAGKHPWGLEFQEAEAKLLEKMPLCAGNK